MQYDIVIGLEIHVQLNTQSKLFSSAPTAFGAPPNTQANLIDLAMPGVLPVLNEAAVRKAAIFGFAINATVANHCVFDRKNYFYPDLPKGYQISQLTHPIVQHGEIEIECDDGTFKTIQIERAHLEEDAGKSLHEDFAGMSGIDLNRAGTPLIEIVTAPVLSSAKEAVAYMKKIHSLVRYLGISDANMQEGSFRCDANVSIKPKGQTALGTRTEIKNLNSFRFIEQAINYEVERQQDLLAVGKTVVQETRLYDPDAGETRAMRSKETANDYRYFPDPDLAPVKLSEAYLAEIRSAMPELQASKIARYHAEYGIKHEDAVLLVETYETAQYFESASQQGNGKMVANWMISDLLPSLKAEGLAIQNAPITPPVFAQLIQCVNDGTISGKAGKTVFSALWQGETDVQQVINDKGLSQMSDASELAAIVDEMLAAHGAQFEDFKQGNDKMMAFFVGQMMKKTQGKANPKLVNELIRKKASTS
ncbi:Asp-tRNA(Asn)/Glu-tRNA(Gln) amidotransferase subunit GatB [Cardiobacteriales bacterium ML27]|uniref:Aspartyl/glutamyl-tRNA(Asn/Gln) amidotransferase subunit B n=2 Tax=Ostreibacterium oceani TaxID=2654998 RepID=A0A6N7ESQ1_9GAMM|nr:Asp-tRNA(Asn)/Glu-tRNA(Gln) amidotransferase subunit GatB [Ostreibacterium oceani]